MQTINSGNRNYYDSLQFWEIIKVIIGVRGSFSEKRSLPGGGGGAVNKSYESSTK